MFCHEQARSLSFDLGEKNLFNQVTTENPFKIRPLEFDRLEVPNCQRRERMESTVKVGVRIRPLLSKERHQTNSLSNYDSQSIEFKNQTFTYDYVFGMDLPQQELYQDTAAPMLKSFLDGFNVTIIAYGQTGSGKTYTMGTADNDSQDPNSEGLIPRFVCDLFDNLENFSRHETLESNVSQHFPLSLLLCLIQPSLCLLPSTTGQGLLSGNLW
jgi:hypothetical protein